DMAHLPVAIENISILAAIEVVAEQLWDGQERSTRYQEFSVTGYALPDEAANASWREAYVEAAEGLFAAYQAISAAAARHYRELLPRPEGMDEAAYERALRARAFDV